MRINFYVVKFFGSAELVRAAKSFLLITSKGQCYTYSLFLSLSLAEISGLFCIFLQNISAIVANFPIPLARKVIK